MIIIKFVAAIHFIHCRRQGGRKEEQYGRQFILNDTILNPCI